MGNLDFLEKKPRIAYTLSWDGVTEGKVTNTTGSRKVYKISSEEFIPRPDIVWTPTGSSSIPCNTPENIRLEKNYHFHNLEDVSNVSVSVLKEDTSKAGYYKFFLMFGDNDTGNNSIDLFYVLVTNKEILSGDFGNVNPTFSEIGWYIGSPSNTEAGDIMSILKDPLVQFSYSGKGFTSPQKPYRYVSNSIQSDDIITIWIDMYRYSENDDYINLISVPGDFNQEYNIELNEEFAELLKYIGVNQVDLMIREGDSINSERHNSYLSPCKLSVNISSNKGLEIRDDVIGIIYRNKSINMNMMLEFDEKYMYSEP